MTTASTACSVWGEGVHIWQADPGKQSRAGRMCARLQNAAGAAHWGLNPKATPAQVTTLLKAGVYTE